jgi:hypothetical protein
MLNTKKILAFSMLLLTAAPIYFFTGIIVKQKIIQLGMKEKLANSSLQTIGINEINSSWIKINEEISIEGKLFDVKSVKVLNGITMVTGLYDNDENILLELLNNFISNKSETDSNPSKAIVKFSFPALYPISTPLYKHNIYLITCTHFKEFNEWNILSNFINNPSPPPKFS